MSDVLLNVNHFHQVCALLVSALLWNSYELPRGRDSHNSLPDCLVILEFLWNFHLYLTIWSSLTANILFCLVFCVFYFVYSLWQLTAYSLVMSIILITFPNAAAEITWQWLGIGQSSKWSQIHNQNESCKLHLWNSQGSLIIYILGSCLDRCLLDHCNCPHLTNILSCSLEFILCPKACPRHAHFPATDDFDFHVLCQCRFAPSASLTEGFVIPPGLQSWCTICLDVFLTFMNLMVFTFFL